MSGSVNQELLLRNEYLVAEDRILRQKLPSRRRLSNPERATPAEIGKRLGHKALREVACVAKPDTILAWYRRLVVQKFDSSKHRQYPGRLPVSSEVEALVVRMARENSGWGPGSSNRGFSFAWFMGPETFPGAVFQAENGDARPTVSGGLQG